MLEEIRKRTFITGDPAIWAIYALLCIVSVLAVYSASSNVAFQTDHFWKIPMYHFGYILFGTVVLWVSHKLPSAVIKGIALFAFLISLIALFIVLGQGSINDASRWIRLGGITLQPSEFAKGALIGTVSIILSNSYDKKKQETRTDGLWLVYILTFITCALIITENLSTAMILLLVIGGMVFVSKPPVKFFFNTVGLAAIPIILAYGIFRYTPLETFQNVSAFHRAGTWAARIQNKEELPENPLDYKVKDKNRQVTFAKIAVSTSGIGGCGVGKSSIRNYLSAPNSDFIYAIIIEEWGMVFAAGIMFLYLWLLHRCIVIARKARSQFNKLLLIGLALLIVMQAMVNMGVAVGALPVTGQPLPLISKGGSSFLVTSFYIGVMLGISHRVNQSEKKRKKEESMKKIKQDE